MKDHLLLKKPKLIFGEKHLLVLNQNWHIGQTSEIYLIKKEKNWYLINDFNFLLIVFEIKVYILRHSNNHLKMKTFLNPYFKFFSFLIAPLKGWCTIQSPLLTIHPFGGWFNLKGESSFVKLIHPFKKGDSPFKIHFRLIS